MLFKNEMNRNFTQNAYLIKTSILWSVVFFLACSSIKNQSDEIILAEIGQKKISVKEFLQRSELTIRPSHFKSKNTALNNLISEKILALEAERDKKLKNNPVLQGKLKGIKEQAMRDSLYNEVAFDKAEIDSHEVKNDVRLSMREYELEFYTIHDKELARKLEARLDSDPEFANEIFKEAEAYLGKKPTHKVNYLDQDDDVIHESLFTNLLEIGDVIGPIRLSNGDDIIMRVLNWVDYPLIGKEDKQIRWKKIREKIHEMKARKLWQSYQMDIMQGKKIEFNREPFLILSEWAMDRYINNSDNASLDFQIEEIPPIKPEINLDAPFFTIDNQLWTVEDFKNELVSHPLVFRTKILNKTNFAEQFKLAIVDMVRDHYLTKEAYKRSLDDSEEIERSVETWKDAYLAIIQKELIMESLLKQDTIEKDDKEGITKYWESYLVNLQEKYNPSIRINYDAYDQIALTNIDFFAIRPGVPFPIAVPGFPMLIASGNLDYSK